MKNKLMVGNHYQNNPRFLRPRLLHFFADTKRSWNFDGICCGNSVDRNRARDKKGRR